MDWKSGDLLYHYQGNYDADGNFVLGKQIKVKCTGLSAAGKPIISVLTGSSELKPGQRFIRTGSISDTTRQNGMFFDTITAYKPRMVVYDGFNSYTKFSDDYIIDPSLTIAQIGNLSSVYNANMGGYLTGHKGIYTKSLFADISGSSMFLITEDANNYFYFNGGVMDIAASRFSLKTTNLGILSGSSAMILLGHATNYASAKIGFKNDGSGKLASGNISWDTSGNVTQSGSWTSDATITGATIQTAASGHRVVMSSSGLFGYHNTLGTVFKIPTNGEAPEFSSGTIKEAIYEIYTSGIIRTSATVANGGAGSAGILINNTGIYGCGANQDTTNANFRIYATNGAAYFNGTITANAGTIGGFNIYAGSITATNLGLISGANGMILLGHDSLYASAKIGFKNDGSGKLASGNISWDTSGNVTQTGTWTCSATITGGTFQTAASGNRVVMSSSGLFGYHTTLGTVFKIPTNGDAPEFLSGTIKESIIEIYTSGLMRTSATAVDGSASSAGVLINNTGIYAAGANQNTSNANVRILATGAAYFSGTVTASAGTIGGWTLGSATLASTNIGLISGASAMILLGHASDYATAKIGLKNDGSGKLASGNFSWDASGNITGAGTWTNTATITGGVYQTAASGARIVLSGSTNKMTIYNSDGTETGSIYGTVGTYGVFNIQGKTIDISPLNELLIYTSGDIKINAQNGIKFGAQKFIINSSGQLTKANNIAAGTIGRVLRDDGTNFTPATLDLSDLSALTGSQACVTDINGKVATIAVTSTEVGYLAGVTSAIQTQLDGKQATVSWGSLGQANRFVAATSGGSPTVELGKRTLTFGGTTVDVACFN